jgi:hypothetical protein
VHSGGGHAWELFCRGCGVLGVLELLRQRYHVVCWVCWVLGQHFDQIAPEIRGVLDLVEVRGRLWGVWCWV